MKQLFLFPLIASIGCLPLTALANALHSEAVVSGGILAPSDNRFLSDENGEHAFLTENVLRLSLYFETGFSISGQVIYREAGDNYDSDPRIDFLQLDYRTSWYQDSEQVITLGRFKTRQGIYNESRDIPFTRPSILLPQSVYLDSTRNFQLSADGLRLRLYHPFAESDLSFGLASGQSTLDDKFSEVALAPTAKGNWDSDNNFYADVYWESQNWTLGMSFSDVALDYNASSDSFFQVDIGGGIIVPVPLIDGEFDASFTTLSAQYRQESWEFTAEAIERQFDSSGFAIPDQQQRSYINGFYLQYRHLFNSRWSGLLRYDAMDIDFKDNPPFASEDNNALEAIDKTLGIMWAPSEHWLVGFEYHYISGGAWIPPITKLTGANDFEKNWSLTALQISYKF